MAVFAAIKDQENLIGTGRESRSVKQHGQATLPKTPAGKGGCQSLQHEAQLKCGTHKNDQYGNQAFVTPQNKTVRAPLHAKTANAKHLLLKTPIIPPPPTESLSIRRTRRTQFRVHRADESEDENVDGIEEREIEYMAPRGKPLPDLPDEDIWPNDRDYEQFKGDNFISGWSSFVISHDEDSDYDEQYRQAQAREAQQPTPSHGEAEIGISHVRDVSVVEHTHHSTKSTSSSRVGVLGHFASATSASIARRKQSSTTADATKHISALQNAQARPSRILDAVRTQTSQDIGHRVSITAPYVENSTQDVRHQHSSYRSEDDWVDDMRSPPDLLALEGLLDFQLNTATD